MAIQKIGNLPPTTQAYELSKLLENRDAFYLAITEDMNAAYRLFDEVRFFSGHGENIDLLPDWETLPYDHFSPHEDIISARIRLFNRLPDMRSGCLIVSIQNLMQRLPPVSYVRANSFVISSAGHSQQGSHFDLKKQRQLLTQAGYHAVDQVERRGEYALRGSIFDVFPMGANKPFRIDLFDDQVDSIRTFDIDSQRSLEAVSSIDILPAREFPFTPESCKKFCENWYESFPENTLQSPTLESVEQDQQAPGLEHYLPFFFDQTATLLDYVPEQSELILLNNSAEKAEHFWLDVNNRYEQFRFDLNRPPIEPLHAFIEPQNLFKQAKNYSQRKWLSTPEKHNASFRKLPDIAIQSQLAKPWCRLADFLTEQNQETTRILFVAESEGRREVVLEHLQKINVYPKTLKSDAKQNTHLAITTGRIEQGFIDPDKATIFITEAELFSQHVAQRRRTKKTNDKHLAVKDLSELVIGMPIVHLEQGIGRYQGLKTLNLTGEPQDFFMLEYAKGDKLYVPVQNLHLISRYSATTLDKAPINTLGTDTWSKTKTKALKRLYDTAADLLDIYAKRAAKQGFRYNAHEDLYQNFAAQFPFEETPDQQRAIDEVISDMCALRPMDRLLCGDVGFGKTEVAMRAAFVAVQNNKQVAVLVPTTLLANQHFENFSDRFANWPVCIEMLSRFKSTKQNNETIEKIKAGKVDIVIGTHKLLSKLVGFKDLGLSIIDEEHRFGVRHKDQLKALRADVDILAMTATPIPRSLNLSLSQVRDLSIIATPPLKRLSIKTFVNERKDAVIKEAILREVLRGGQVYFLHNDVKTMPLMLSELQTLMPEVKIVMAHGQMRERDLEKVMADFYHNRYHVLLCSTIIETGIDVPNANTILINRADKLGLAQLHQLRGRVGRSHHQAYAYLLTPEWQSLTNEAKQRLEAIEQTRELGSGFTLASHDLEIRGAGEILGDEQSGHMQQIGFTLYMELLDRAVKALQKGEKPKLDAQIIDSQCEVELGTSCILPEEFIPDVSTRLDFYRRFSSASCEAEIEDLQVELIDRFGLLPEPTKNLVHQAMIRTIGQSLGIRRIGVTPKAVKIDFQAKPKIDPMRIIQLIQKQPDRFQMSGQDSLRAVMLDTKEPAPIGERVMGVLNRLMG